MTSINVKKSIQKILNQVENYTSNHRVNRLNEDDCSDQIRKLDVAALMEKDIPVTVTFGPQCSGKTSVLNRLIGFPFLNTNSKRETLCLYEIKIRKNDNIKHQEVTVKLDGIPIGQKMRFDLTSDNDKNTLRRILKEEQEKLVESNPGKSFYDNIITVEIQSSVFKDCYDLLDLPGLIAVDTSLSHEGAPKEIVNLVKKTNETRKVNYLLIHDARGQLENNGALKFLSDVGAKKSDINCVFTRCDGVLEDEQERDDLLKLVKNGNAKISSDKIFLIVNRASAEGKKDELFNDSRENEWWKQQNIDEVISKKCGIQILRENVVNVSTKVLVENSLPQLKKILIAELSNLEKSLKIKNQKCADLHKNPFDILKCVESELVFIYKQDDGNNKGDKQLTDFKNEITAMYTEVLKKVMDMVKRDLLLKDFDATEEDTNDETFCVENYSFGEQSKAEKFMFDNQGIAAEVRTDGLNLNLLFRRVCETWVEKIEEFGSRKDINSDFIKKMNDCLIYICQKNTPSNPKLRELIMRIFKEESKKAEEEFNNFIDNKIFKWYKTVTPYKLLVGTELDLKEYMDEITQTPKAIKTLEEAYEPYCKQALTYLMKFVDKLWVDTQTAMRCDVITELFEHLSKILERKLTEEMEAKGINTKQFQSSDINEKILEDLENCKKEKTELENLLSDIEKCEQEYRQFKFNSAQA